MTPRAPAPTPPSTRRVDQLAGGLADLWRRRDAAGLAAALFGHVDAESLTPGQAEIASLFAFLEHRRAVVRGPTRFGKTRAAGAGLGISSILDPRPLSIAVVAPRQDQAGLIRGEYVDAMVRSPLGRRLLGATGRDVADRMRRRLSQRRIDLRNGKRLAVFSAADDAERIMGFGADVVVVDECDLVPSAAWPKVLRMLGDDPEGGGWLILLGNPWVQGGRFWRAFRDPAYRKVVITPERAIREGRLSAAFMEEMRGEGGMPELHYRVLYLSEFPEAVRGQLIPWDWIVRAAHPSAADVLEGVPAHHVQTRYGLDVAEGGGDRNVLTPVRVHGRALTLRAVAGAQTSWETPDTEETVDRAAGLMPARSVVVVDANGVGKGVADGLRRKRYRVVEFKAGESAAQKDDYRDRGSEAWWLMRRALEEERVRVPDEPHLHAELAQPRWHAVGRRVAVEKRPKRGEDDAPPPEASRSPDRADSLVMALFGDVAEKRRTLWSG